MRRLAISILLACLCASIFAQTRKQIEIIDDTTTSVADAQTTYELFFSQTFIRFIESYNYSGKSVRLVK